ncbi:MAG: SpoIIE family protein phosphatase [Acidobacteria bacterium]|nr:SpoIIE family protein phosphatase [Acidobacteriota bacterium]
MSGRETGKRRPRKNGGSRRGFHLFLAVWTATLAVQVGIVWSSLALDSPLRGGGIALDFGASGTTVRDLARESPFRAVGLRPGDLLRAFRDGNGERIPVRGLRDIARAHRALRFGSPWVIEVEREMPGGRTVTLELPVPPWPRPSNYVARNSGLLLSLLPFFVINFLTAGFIAILKPDDRAARNAAYLFLSFCVLGWGDASNLLPEPASQFSTLVWITLFSCMSAFFLRFFLQFPSPSPVAVRFPWLMRAAAWVGAVFSVWNLLWHFLPYYDVRAFVLYLRPVIVVDYVLDVIYVLAALAGFASLVTNIRRTPSPGERRRLIVLLFCVAGLLPWLVSFLMSAVFGYAFSRGFALLLNLLRIFIPIFFAWAVIKHRMFGARVILRKGLRFALLSNGFLFLEGILVFLGLYYGLGPAVTRTFGTRQHEFLLAATAGATLGALVLIGRVNRGMMRVLERKYFRESHDAHEILARFGTDLRRHCMQPEQVFTLLLGTATRVFHPARAALFVRLRELAALPAESEAMKQLRRTGGSSPETAFTCVADALHDPDGTLEVRCPSPLSGDAGRESRALRLLRLKGGEQGTPLTISPRRRRWLEPEAEAAADRGDPLIFEELRTQLIVPLVREESMFAFLCLGEKLSEEPYSREDAEFLQTMAQQVSATLDHAVLILQSREQSQLLREMEIARQVQSNLFPAATIPIPGLDYVGTCRPARYVGGDYYDFLRVGSYKLALALGDIAGKGVSAALLMAGLQATLRMQVDLQGDRTGEILGEINRRFCTTSEERRFATLFLGVYDPVSRVLTYASAGHNPPLLFRGGGDGSTPEALAATGPLLGVVPDLRYPSPSVRLEPGDLLVIYSDGVTEAMNDAGDLFGEEEFARFIGARQDLPPARLVDEVLAEVRRFVGAAPQSDDITLVVARVTCDPVP